jgi:hypothetical protein
VTLRQFLYRDDDLVREFLSQLEGGLVQDRSQTLRSAGGSAIGATVHAGPVGGKAGREREQSEESSTVVEQTGAARFERLYQQLDRDGEIQYLENIDDAIWDQIRRGEVVEVEAVIRPVGFGKIGELLQSFEKLVPLAQALGSEDLDEKSLGELEVLRGLTDTGDVTHVVALLASAQKFKFACALRYRYLVADATLLEGEGTLVGKIQRKLKRGEQELVGGLFGGLEDALPKDERKRLVDAFQAPEIKALGIESPLIRYPAAVLTPIAIYR